MLAALYNKIRTLLDREHDRYILFVPVFMSTGVAWYFSLKNEPPLWLGSALFLTLIVTAVLCRRMVVVRYACIGMALIAFGFALSQWRTNRIHSPYLDGPIAITRVSGKIVEIAPTPKGSKLLLEDVTINKIPPEKTPTNISVTLRSYDPTLVTGQRVSLRAGLFPPPPMALPGGFDFSRYFYFREIGAVGYGILPMEVKSLKESGASDFDVWFAEFRHRLTESIRSHFREPAGAVAAAFVTGEVRAIPDEINDNMRVAGLYHLLAVSGMNLSVVAGLAFFSFRFAFACVPGVALRYPIKKWAALLALIASYIYLRISGTPVSAERAFFMVSLIFIAMLLDRDPTPMRSVSFAAFCILLYEPEAVLTASFQLSFNATAALIASYEWGIGWFAQHNKQGGFGLRYVVFYFAAVIAASLVAWLATEPFIIYHFNQFSSYSLLSNTIAEPLVSFILMPLVIAGVLLIPFGLAGLAFAPMQYGVDLLLWIARWTSHLPHAMWIVPSPTDAGFIGVLLGGIWIYFWRERWRWLGLIAVMGGLATAFFYVPPDVIISGDGKHIAVRAPNGDIVMVRGRAQNLTAQQWARAEIQHDFTDQDITQCDDKGCTAHVGKHIIAMPDEMGALSDDCQMADVVIAAFPIDHAACSAPLFIDKTRLDSGGATALWFTGEKITVKQVRTEVGDRPWSRATEAAILPPEK